MIACFCCLHKTLAPPKPGHEREGPSRRDQAPTRVALRDVQSALRIPLNLLRAVTTVSGMTLLSRITGLARESLKAVAVRRGRADGRVRGGVPAAEHPAADVRRRCVLAGVRADPGRIPAPARRRRDARPRGPRRALLAVALVLIASPSSASWQRPGSCTCWPRGFAQTPGKVELTADMLRIVFPYIAVRVAGVACRRRAQRVPAVRHSRVHAGAPQPVDHRRGDLPVAATSIRRSSRWRGACSSAASRSSRCRSCRSRGSACCRDCQLDFARRRRARACCCSMGPAVIGVSAAQISALINTQLAA